MRWPVIRPGDLVGVILEVVNDFQDVLTYSMLELHDVSSAINHLTGKPQQSITRWLPSNMTDELTTKDVLFVIAISKPDEENDVMAYVMSSRAIGWTWLDLEKQRMLEKLLSHEEKTN